MVWKLVGSTLLEVLARSGAGGKVQPTAWLVTVWHWPLCSHLCKAPSQDRPPQARSWVDRCHPEGEAGKVSW